MSRCNYEIDELDLSVRVYNVLLLAGITTISDLKSYDDEMLEKIKGLSKKGIEEIKEKLKNFKDNSIDGWISAKDKLPKPFVSVLGYIANEEPFPSVREVYLTNSGHFYIPALCYITDVNYWQEMPEPPKGE